MTKVAQRSGVQFIDAQAVVQLTLDSITDALAREGRLELRDFGVFEVVARKAKKARNPRTGTPVTVPARRKVRFKPGKVMEERVGGGGEDYRGGFEV